MSEIKMLLRKCKLCNINCFNIAICKRCISTIKIKTLFIFPITRIIFTKTGKRTSNVYIVISKCKDNTFISYSFVIVTNAINPIILFSKHIYITVRDDKILIYKIFCIRNYILYIIYPVTSLIKFSQIGTNCSHVYSSVNYFHSNSQIILIVGQVMAHPIFPITSITCISYFIKAGCIYCSINNRYFSTIQKPISRARLANTINPIASLGYLHSIIFIISGNIHCTVNNRNINNRNTAGERIRCFFYPITTCFTIIFFTVYSCRINSPLVCCDRINRDTVNLLHTTINPITSFTRTIMFFLIRTTYIYHRDRNIPLSPCQIRKQKKYSGCNKRLFHTGYLHTEKLKRKLSKKQEGRLA